MLEVNSYTHTYAKDPKATLRIIIKKSNSMKLHQHFQLIV